MQLEGRVALLTGATGGIGSALATQLANAGVRLVLAGRDSAALEAIAIALPDGSVAAMQSADLNDADAPDTLAEAARHHGVSILINAIGVNDAVLFGEQDSARLNAIIETNLLAPMRLTRALLPVLQSANEALIVNIGSAYGAIGHPGYVAYSASKFGLRGFSEALRRELADTRVGVMYAGPRAVATRMNEGAGDALNKALDASVDDPREVARLIVRQMRGRRALRHIGWPERLFVRINQLFPSVVDRALAGKLQVVRQALSGTADK